MEGISNYGAAKAGLVGLSKCLALEGAAHGILVNCVLPQADTGATSSKVAGRTMVPSARDGVVAAREKMGTRVTADLVSPLIAYLVSNECTLSGEVLSTGAGTYARVFAGLTLGWTSPGDTVTAEDVRDNLEKILELDGYRMPRSCPDEMHIFADQLQALAERH
jgi:hypothetical protein